MKVKLAEFREALGVSQDDIANLLGVSRSYYEKVEQGNRNPSYNFIKKFVEQYPQSNIRQIFFS